ncbi:N-acetylmuramoyl-L-alanine amidase family protein, partial [Pseudoalteromonas sp. SIMBA_162]|uniref:peptidoglycan recognition protein family protein n=1 Tax=Pseudoalteromonas sp. SIMBA_162 TaxID=3080867 RepID=UPI00397A6DA9
MTSIGIEICENPETDTKKAEENAIALTVYLMKLFGIPVRNVVPHQKWSGKFCPRVILKRDGGFEKFSNRIAAALKEKPLVETKPKEKDVLNMKMKEVPNVNHKALADVYTDARKAG